MGATTFRHVTFLLAVSLSLILLGANSYAREVGPNERSYRGIYITDNIARYTSHFKDIRASAQISGINTLVIDVKRILEKPILASAKTGSLHQVQPQLNEWLRQLIQKLHGEGFRVIGRIVVFKDEHLIQARPDLGVRKISTGNVWLDHQNARWADPYSKEVQEYNFIVAMGAALSGVDEIQFDYIRFPTNGNIQNIKYSFQDKRSHSMVIADFLKKVKVGLNKDYPHVSLAVDVFGVVVWQDRKDVEHLGQELNILAPYIDVVCPMIYPSHFYPGRDGFSNPGAHPHYFVKKSLAKAKLILNGTSVRIVPWLQGFNLKSPNFGPSYVREQIVAAEEEGIHDFLIWNARNVYQTTFSALKMR